MNPLDLLTLCFYLSKNTKSVPVVRAVNEKIRGVCTWHLFCIVLGHQEYIARPASVEKVEFR